MNCSDCILYTQSFSQLNNESIFNHELSSFQEVKLLLESDFYSLFVLNKEFLNWKVNV